MDTIQVYQGLGSAWEGQVPKADGTPAIGIYTGNEPLYGAVFQGTIFATPVFTFTPTWKTPNGGPEGKIVFPFQPSQTQAVWPGTYRVICSLASFAQPLIECELQILASPLSTASTGSGRTRALADYAMIRRVALAASKAAIILDSGSPISQFDDPLSRSLAFMKITASNPVVPADEDIEKVPANKWQQLLDIAEFEFYAWSTSMLTVASGVMTEQKWPDYSYRLDPQATLFMQQSLKNREEFCRRVYGYGSAPLKYGAIDLAFQAGSGPDGGEF